MYSFLGENMACYAESPWPVTGQREVGELGESTFIVVSMRRKRQGRTV